MMGARLGTRRGMAWAMCAALVAHGLLLWWLGNDTPDRDRDRDRDPAHNNNNADATAHREPTSAANTDSTAAVALLDLTPVPTGARPEAISGTHDEIADNHTPAHPRSDRDIAGRTLASLGGGAAGGPDSFTGRHDHENFQTRPWNTPRDNRLARHADDTPTPTPSSPESLTRDRARGFDDRTETRTRAHAGSDTPMAGHGAVDPTSEQPGSRGIPIPERDADTDPDTDLRTRDPMFDGNTGAMAPRRVAGAMTATSQALTEVGERATEADKRHPRVRDTSNTAAASDELDPAPIEMTRQRAGGRDTGVAGARTRDGLSARGQGRTGTAASRAAGADNDPATTWADRRIGYFERMYRRMNERVVFPEELAVTLRQGEVLVRFTLARDGKVSGLTLVKSSGYQAFDDQVLEAVRHVAPFGRVPDAVLDGRSAITVLVPYVFKNPLIR